MKTLNVILFLLGCFWMSVCAFGKDLWLPEAPSFPQPKWQRVAESLYIDLGDDPEALVRLASSPYVEDVPEVAAAKGLACPSAYKKYLIRSFFLGRPTARVYKTSNGLVVSTGAFTDPRQPDRGAIAICLKDPPGRIEGAASFLK